MEPSDSAYAALQELAGKDFILLFLPCEWQARAGWNVIGGDALLQMVCDHDRAETLRDSEALPLGLPDVPEMRDLAAQTQPGPFEPRTHELGDFFGIRREGRLVAMAGERMKVPGFTEVSAVCTMPEYAGRGYAAQAMRRVMHGITERGETAFLHVRAGNRRAVDLYARLGFRVFATLRYVELERTAC